MPGKLPRRATLRTCNQDRVETNAEESSKRLCFDKIRLLDPRHFHHMHYTTSPCKAIRPSTNRKPTWCDDDSIRSTPKAKRPQNLNYDPKLLAGFLQHFFSKPFPSSLLNHNHPTKSNSRAPLPLRLTFAHLAADGQQDMKVLFLIDHATKGDAIHHAIGAYVHPDSSEMVLLVCNHLSECSSLQNHFLPRHGESARNSRRGWSL